MRIAAALAALLLSSSAYAQTGGQAILSCTAPTKNLDGSAIKAPVTFKFYMGTTTGVYPNSSPAQPACAYMWTGLTVGTYFFAATAIDGNGVESGRSNEATKSFLSPPAPPTGLTATGSLTAYQLVLSNKLVAFVAVGTLAPGTMCDSAQPVGDKFVVDRTQVVSWFGNVKPQLVVASCG